MSENGPALSAGPIIKALEYGSHRKAVMIGKPSPRMFRLALKLAREEAKYAVMVGDHPIDVQAGKRVGMKTVGVLTGRTKNEEFEKAGADYVLKEASDVCALLEGEDP